MQPNIHPIYRPVLFRDASTGHTFLTRSTIQTAATAEWTDGQTYPLVILEVTAQSHPYFTGQQRLMDTAGRVERFTRKYARAAAAAEG